MIAYIIGRAIGSEGRWASCATVLLLLQSVLMSHVVLMVWWWVYWQAKSLRVALHIDVVSLRYSSHR